MVTANWRKNWPVMPRDERARHEHRAQHQGHGDDGPVTSSIALRAASRGAQALLQPALDVLHHHDGVIHDDADGQHQAEQRQVVQAEAEPAMTAKVPTMATGTAISGISAARQFCRNTQHHDGHQDHRVAQRLEDLVDRLADERRRVVDDLVVQALGEARLQLVHLGVHPIRHRRVQGVGAGQLKDQPASRTAGRRACTTVVAALRPARRGPRRAGGRPASLAGVPSPIGLEDDVARTARLGQPAEGAHRYWKCWPRAPAAGRSVRRPPDVLLAQGLDHVAGRQVPRPPACPGRANTRML